MNWTNSTTTISDEWHSPYGAATQVGLWLERPIHSIAPSDKQVFHISFCYAAAHISYCIHLPFLTTSSLVKRSLIDSRTRIRPRTEIARHSRNKVLPKFRRFLIRSPGISTTHARVLLAIPLAIAWARKAIGKFWGKDWRTH